MTKGAYILISATIAGTPTVLGLSRDCGLEVSSGMMEVASATSSEAKEFLPSRVEFGLNSSHLVGKFTVGMLDWLIANNQPIELNLHQDTDEDNEFSIVASAFLRSYKLGAPLHGFATADIELQGTDRIIPLAIELEEGIWTEDDWTQIFTWNHSKWA